MIRRALLVLCVLSLTVVQTFAADQSDGGMKGMPHRINQHGMMHQQDGMMQQMMQNPLHMLAMAYHKNLVTFARALEKAAQRGDTVPREFARAAAVEMRRSADQMEIYHDEAAKSLTAEQKAQHAEMAKKMATHLAQMKSELAKIDDLTKAERIDSKELLPHLQILLKGCREMMGGRDGCAMHGAGMPCKHDDKPCKQDGKPCMMDGKPGMMDGKPCMMDGKPGPCMKDGKQGPCKHDCKKEGCRHGGMQGGCEHGGKMGGCEKCGMKGGCEHCCGGMKGGCQGCEHCEHGCEMHGAMHGGMHGGMMHHGPQGWPEMMQQRQQMMAQMKAQDAELSKLADAMNRASGAQQQRAMADLLNLMVRQRVDMVSQMERMQEQMKHHMGAGMSGMPGSDDDGYYDDDSDRDSDDMEDDSDSGGSDMDMKGMKM